MKPFDIVAVGESLVDFVPGTGNDTGKIYMEGSAGGAPANMLAMAARLGRQTAFIGKVGRDAFGDFLRHCVEAAGVDVRGMVSGSELTTLAMVALDDTGNRSFSFYRNNTADVMLQEYEVDFSLCENTRIFHFGTVSMVQNPAASTTLACVHRARDAGAKISFDPNYRPLLWQRDEDAVAAILSGLELAHYAKLSEEEATLVTGEDDAEKAALQLMSRYGFELLAVTMGPKGTIGFSPDGRINIPAYDVTVVDTTGAGDAFWGAVLHKRLQSRRPQVGQKELDSLMRFGAAAGSLSTAKKGAIPAQPNEKEIEACIKAGQFAR